MNVATVDRQVARRRVVEALRAGVPSRDTVAMLGSSQPEIEDRFSALADQLASLPGSGVHPGGVLIGGVSAPARAMSSSTWVDWPSRPASW